MGSPKVVPVVITRRSGEPMVVSAFETAERAENAKIDCWAETFARNTLNSHNGISDVEHREILRLGFGAFHCDQEKFSISSLA